MKRHLSALLLLGACHRQPAALAEPRVGATSPTTVGDVVTARLQGPAEWSGAGAFVQIPAGWVAVASGSDGLQLEHLESGVGVRLEQRAAGPSGPREGEVVAFSDTGHFRRVFALAPAGTTTFRRPDGSVRVEWWTGHATGIHVDVVARPGRLLQALTVAEEVLVGLRLR